MNTQSEVRVWDPLVRVIHWTLVVAFATAYLTGEDGPEWLHVWSGYVLVALILVRLVWGFVGSAYARFRDFIYAPSTILSYLVRLPLGKARRYLGHSPAGGAMVVALLLGLAGTTGSGLMLYAVEEGSGPLAPLVSVDGTDFGPVLGIATARADEEENEYSGGGREDREHFWEEIHEFLANFTLILVFLHIAGVLFSSLAHHENLVRAMFNGRKRAT